MRGLESPTSTTGSQLEPRTLERMKSDSRCRYTGRADGREHGRSIGDVQSNESLGPDRVEPRKCKYGPSADQERSRAGGRRDATTSRRRFCSNAFGPRARLPRVKANSRRVAVRRNDNKSRSVKKTLDKIS